MTETLAHRLPVTFTYQHARELGVSKRQLYRWRDEGFIEAIGRGLFHRADAPPADLDLIEVAYRAPEATLCLTSALVRHNLSDAIPVSHDIAVPRGHWTPVVSAPVTWHRFDPTTYGVGKEYIRLDKDTALGIYGAERSIVDSFRLASRYGSDVAHDALRQWLRGGGKPVELLEVARYFPRAVPRIRSAMEVLL